MCIQGSHWSRKNRMFVMHDSRPQLLSTLVAPSDIMAFNGGDPSSRYVLYSDTQKAAWVTDLREGIKVSLKRAESDLVTIVPLHEVKGLSVAPIGEPLCGECCCCITCQAADFLPLKYGHPFLRCLAARPHTAGQGCWICHQRTHGVLCGSVCYP